MQAQEIKGLATKADLECMVNELKTFVTNELSPMKADIGNIKVDIAAMKNELTHKVNTSAMYGTVGAALVLGVGAVFALLKYILPLAH